MIAKVQNFFYSQNLCTNA